MFVYIVLGPVVLGIVLNAPGLYNKSSSAGPVAPQKRGLSPGEKKTTEEEIPAPITIITKSCIKPQGEMQLFAILTRFRQF